MSNTLTGLRKTGTAWLAALVVMASGLGTVATHAQAAGPSAQATTVAQKALTWMIAAAGENAATYVNAGKSPVDFLNSKAADLAKTPGGAGKLLLAAWALKQTGSPLILPAGVVEDLSGGIGANGQYGKDVIGHAFAMLGLAVTTGSVPAKAVEFLKSAQAPDGGWSFTGDTKAGAADTNTTAVAIQALVAAGAGKSEMGVLERAQKYLLLQQGADGGFPYQKGGEGGDESDVNSTSYVVQALRSIGATADLEKPLAYLMSMQKSNGAFQWMKSVADDNAGATYQAVPAILGATLAQPAGQAAGGTGNTGGGTEVGMPRTGNTGEPTGTGVLAALALLMLGGGLAARRRSRNSGA